MRDSNHQGEKTDFPSTLHAKIVGRLFVSRFKRAFIAMLALLTASLLLLGWHIWTFMDETGAGIFASAAFDDFSSDYTLLPDMDMVNEFFPVDSLAAFAANALIVGYMLHILFAFRKMTFYKNGRSV